MTTKRAKQIADSIAKKETLNPRTLRAFKKFLNSRGEKWIYANCRKSHGARGRGYVRVGQVGIEPYFGRFGVGFKIKYPNNQSPKPSNMYYDFDYYLIG